MCTLLVAEASCSSQIYTAQAVAQDMGTQKAVETGVQSWASCHPSNSERDVHRVIKKQGTKLNIAIHMIQCDGVEIPWISPETWLDFLVRKGLWPLLAGRELHDYAGAHASWLEFWKNYEKVNPSFELFHQSNVDYGNTAAFFLHGDEGRTLKKGGMLVTSLQSALGKGFDEKRVKKGQAPKLRVNFAGHTYTTRYVINTIPKTAYESNPEVFNSASEHAAKSLMRLFQNGVRDASRGEVFKVVLIGIKGDAPYLSRVGHFYRSFNTAVKRGEERGPPKGVCPYCLAGTRNFVAEQIASSQPAWVQTIGIKLPWVKIPCFIKHCLHDRGDPASFFKSDIWHVVHLGFGRSWVASVLQLCLPHLACANLDEKWDFLTRSYLGWCATNHKQAHISKITGYLVSYGDAGGAMGNWHKGALTSNMCNWLVEFLWQVPSDPEGLLAECRVATFRLNGLFRFLYRASAFLSENECSWVAEQGLHFLRTYSSMALKQYQANRQYLFPLYPKLHIFHHLVLEVKWHGEQIGLSANPLMTSCQMDEDLVGRASRLSRRVSIRKVAQRSLDRYLIGAHAAYVKAKLLS